VRVGIINVTGYSGSELARLLYRHPDAKITSVTGRSAAGEKLGNVFPHLSGLDMVIQPELDGSLDMVFSALPHKASAEAVIPLLEDGIKVVDISADFRLRMASEYEEWYGVPHLGPQYLEEAVYGLTELNRPEVSQARLVANPGCYPTSAILALAPVVKEGLVKPDIVVDSKSGVSGGGRTLNLTNHFSEVNENVMAYALDGHRHLPEITQELNKLNAPASSGMGDGTALALTFLTHLIPMTRGILSSCYARLKPDAFSSWEEAKPRLRQLYQDFYSEEPFVGISSSPPQTKQTLGNNMCLLYPTVDVRTGRLIVISCLDNLVKGAAGQAIQNMNLMFGLPETMALEALAVYP
jgi:N-acetyl-gamma-glutamyl-phosphate reductase